MEEGVCSWREIASVETNCSAEDFLSGLNVWLKKPQVVNRRLVGAVMVAGGGGGEEEEEEEGGSTQEDHHPGGVGTDIAIVRELIPRGKGTESRKETVTIKHDKVGVSVTFDPMNEKDGGTSRGCGSYMFQYKYGDQSRISLSILHCKRETDEEGGDCEETTSPKPNGVTTPTSEWLNSILLPKVVQWAEESGRGLVSTATRRQSLVPLDKYSSLYRDMRDKYGPPLIQNWPETTDPHKFVYEDIAIATYLILLWEGEREEMGLREKQTFIDLGCGNGLLVYLLTSEGYAGKGIDLRRRKIWGYYGNRADLEVCSLTPSDVTLFPEFDWLIGNHSDELTPWIPLMAARSSYHTRYFVLPCCPHDFDSKFRRPDTTRSQYASYLDYVRLIGETVGFKVQEDTLRIPSSKRVCHVGRKRWYSEEEEAEMEEKRRSFLRERCQKSGCGNGEGMARGGTTETAEGVGVVGKKGRDSKENWSDQFVPRSSTEQTRNCARVDRDLQRFIVQTVTTALLETENWISVTSSSNSSRRRQSAAPTADSSVARSDSLLVGPSHHQASSHCEGRFEGEDGASESSVSTSATRELESCISKTVCGNVSGRNDRVSEPLTATTRECCVSCADRGSATSNESPVTTQQDVAAVCHCNNRGGGAGRSGRDSAGGVASTTTPTTITTTIITTDLEQELVTCLVEDAAGVVRTKDCIIVECGKMTGSDGVIYSEKGGSQLAVAKWNLGGSMRVSDAVKLFEAPVLSQLKQECGGLQTLLRNHHQVFEVCGGLVRLRNWADVSSHHGPRRLAKRRSARDAVILAKTKPCWFYTHHPQGCPREACPYAHGQEELKDRPDFGATDAENSSFF